MLLAADGGLLRIESRSVPAARIRSHSEGLTPARLLLGHVGGHRVVAGSFPLLYDRLLRA